MIEADPETGLPRIKPEYAAQGRADRRRAGRQERRVTGHYEVGRETRLGVPVLAIYWITEGEAPMLLTVIAPDRAPLLAEALAEYLAR